GGLRSAPRSRLRGVRPCGRPPRPPIAPLPRGRVPGHARCLEPGTYRPSVARWNYITKNTRPPDAVSALFRIRRTIRSYEPAGKLVHTVQRLAADDFRIGHQDGFDGPGLG